MEVQVTNKDGRVETHEVKKWVDPYPIDLNTKNEIIRVQKSAEQVSDGVFTFEGKPYKFSKVIVENWPTWFIDGHPVMTFLEYEPTRITVQIKMARGGDWSKGGERRKEYQAFVYNVMRVLGCCSFPVFNDRTDDYFNELGMIDCNDMEDAYLIPIKMDVKVKKTYDHYYKVYNDKGYIGTFFVDSISFINR